MVRAIVLSFCGNRIMFWNRCLSSASSAISTPLTSSPAHQQIHLFNPLVFDADAHALDCYSHSSISCLLNTTPVLTAQGSDALGFGDLQLEPSAACRQRLYCASTNPGCLNSALNANIPFNAPFPFTLYPDCVSSRPNIPAFHTFLVAGRHLLSFSAWVPVLHVIFVALFNAATHSA